MHPTTRQTIASALLLTLLAGCGGGSQAVAPHVAAASSRVLHDHKGMHVNVHKSSRHATRRAMDANVVADPGFESGAFGSWSACGNGYATFDSSAPHSGSYDALVGNLASNPGEESGLDGVCQTVTVPASGQLSVWVNEGTSETSTSYADQEADLLDANGNVITTLYSENGNTNGYVQKTFDLSSYAGQSVQLFFGIYGSGSSSDYNYVYVDDVALTGASSTPTPAPSATPVGTPTPSSAAPCNDQQFLNDQAAFANGSLSGDQPEDVCGQVTQVLPSKVTRSGNHGYFYVQMPDGSQIEIVSNLDAMAQAPTNDPPSTWPWVAVGNYVYVQGRYYYDNSSSQGIDWTEDDTSSSWSQVGWVYVCDNSGNNCQKYW